VAARIRDGRAEDAEAIAEVHVRSWQAAYRGQVPDAHLDGMSVEDRARDWRAWLAEPEPSGAVLVAVDEEEHVIGFANVGRSRDEDATAGTGELRAIYLLPAWLGRGVGRSLFAAACERLRDLGYERATLWVLVSNERTRRFYEVAGWAVDGAEDIHLAGDVELPIVRYAATL
jgi:L-amino acid N-acyltransferase YncA